MIIVLSCTSKEGNVCEQPNCQVEASCECTFCAKSLCIHHQALTYSGKPLLVCEDCQRKYQTVHSREIPKELVSAHRTWAAQGRPEQFSSPIVLDLWERYFPDVPELLIDCPVVRCHHGRAFTMINRTYATNFGDRASTTPQAAIDAHLVSMMWGRGKDNRGPSKSKLHLETPGAAESIQFAAQTLKTSGIVAAFNQFVPKTSTGRLNHLGSAFSTKDLFFFSNIKGRHRALIFDSIVSKWLITNLKWRIPAGTENVTDYCRYLYAMYSWAADLKESPEDTEVVMFGWIPNNRWSPC